LWAAKNKRLFTGTTCLIPQTRNVNSYNNFQEREIMNETLSATDHSRTDRPNKAEEAKP